MEIVQICKYLGAWMEKSVIITMRTRIEMARCYVLHGAEEIPNSKLMKYGAMNMVNFLDRHNYQLE